MIYYPLLAPLLACSSYCPLAIFSVQNWAMFLRDNVEITEQKKVFEMDNDYKINS
jgi:hypothetical protein